MDRFPKTTILICCLSFIMGFFQNVLAVRHDDPPHMVIEQAYFKCEASRNLEGGIYGKGPFKKFGPKVSLCSRDEWIKIDQVEFKNLASKWYGIDWNKEIPFWNQRK